MIVDSQTNVTRIRRTLRKWRALFSIYFQDGLAYRASGIIWVITDLTSGITMPFVWASAQKSGAIAGYQTSDFVLYYLCMLALNGFITSHLMWDLSYEIKEGVFSTALVRPISFYQVCFFRNLSWRLIRPFLFLPFFFMLLVLYRPFLSHASVHFSWELVAAVILGHLVSFFWVMAVSMIALFVQEAQSIFELYYGPLLLLSGQLYPIAVLPGWAKSLSHALPFYYTIGAPTEIMVGRVQGDAMHHVLAMQLAWIFASYTLSQILWRYGLRHYSSVGM